MPPGGDLRILLLGPPALYRSGEPFSLSRRGLRSLLYYLACQSRPVARAELMDLFWGDQPEKAARQALRVALSRLKAELPNPEMLVILQEQVSLAQDVYYCDVRGFEIACAETERICTQIPISAPLPEGVLQRLIVAQDLWRGPRFLTGVNLHASAGLDDWLAETGEHLHICHQRMLERLYQHAEACGDLEGAQKWLRKVLALDPTNDLFNLSILALLERQGRIAEALAYLQLARSAYERAGCTELPEQIENAGRQLQARQKPAGPKHTESARPEGVKNTLRLPLIGRKQELVAFHAAYLRNAPVLVTGEAGIGKSRLVREFYSSLSPAPRLLHSSARGLTLQSIGEIPYLSLVEMLRGQVSAQEWRAIPPIWAAILVQLLPEIKIFVPGVRLDVNGGWGRVNIFEALRQTFLNLAARNPLLIVIDDAHLIDESSFLALNYLLSHGFLGEHLHLVLCAQLEAPTAAFRQFRRTLDQDYALKTLELGMFNSAEVAEMVRMVFGRDASPNVIEQLRNDCGGNPLYLLEALRARLDISDSLAGTRPVAGIVHYMMHERLQKLSSDALQLLTLAAACEKSVPFWLLERSSHFPLELLVECLDELQQAHLFELDETPAQEQRYSFVHEMLRDVLLIQLTPARKRLMYVRVAEAIQEHSASSRESQAAGIARLYEQAGDGLTAFEFWLTALRYAARGVSYPEALAACQRAEKLLNQLADQVDAAQVQQLYSTWIELEFTLGHAAEIRQVSARLLAQASSRHNRHLIVCAYMGFATAADLAENSPEGLEMLAQALSYMQQGFAASPREWMLYHYRRGGFLIFQNLFAQAAAELRQALDLADPAAFAEKPAWLYPARANCGYRLAMALLYHGELSQSIAAAEATIQDSRATLNHPSSARAHGMLSTAYFYQGRYALAQEQGQIALHMLEPMQSVRAIATLRANLGRVALATGALDQAWAYAEAALQEGLAGGFKRVTDQALRLQGDIYCMFNDCAAALELYQSILGPTSSSFYFSESQVRIGTMLILTGKVQEGLDLFDQIRQSGQIKEMELVRIQLDTGRASAMMMRGQLSEGLALAEELALQSQARDIPEQYLICESLAVGIILQQGDPDQALRRGLTMAACARELNSPFTELKALSLVLGARAQSADSAQARRRIHELLAELDAHTRLAHLRPAFERFAANLANL